MEKFLVRVPVFWRVLAIAAGMYAAYNIGFRLLNYPNVFASIGAVACFIFMTWVAYKIGASIFAKQPEEDEEYED